MQLPYLPSNLSTKPDFAYNNKEPLFTHSFNASSENLGVLQKDMKSLNLNWNAYKSTKDQLTDTRKTFERAQEEKAK